MEHIKQIISRLNTSEVQQFRESLPARSGRNRDHELIDMLRTDREWTSTELMEALYSPPNFNAFHSLCKRFSKRLIDFIALNRIAQERPGQKYVYAAEFMLERNAPRQAAKHLAKAITLAHKEKDYELLSRIHDLQLAHLDVLKGDIDDIRAKRSENKLNLAVTQKLNDSYADILHAAMEKRKAGVVIDPATILRVVFQDEPMREHAQRNAEFMFRLVSLVRTSFISAKEYHAFAPYVINTYQQMECDGLFSGAGAKYKVRFLYMISQATYRMQRFPDAKEWLAMLFDCFSKKDMHVHPCYAKYITMLASIAAYTGNAHEAICLTSEELEHNAEYMAPNDKLNMLLNLAVNHFQVSQFKQALQIILQIPMYDKSLLDSMGKEWRLKKEMIEALIHFELGNTDIAEARIKKILKDFEKFLTHKSYKRAKTFLGYVLRMIKNPEIVTTQEFYDEVRDGKLRSPKGETEDIQAVSFFCWLLAKMTRRDYYEVLMETLNPAAERKFNFR